MNYIIIEDIYFRDILSFVDYFVGYIFPCDSIAYDNLNILRILPDKNLIFLVTYNIFIPRFI